MIIANRYDITHVLTSLAPESGMWCIREFGPETDEIPRREMLRRYDSRFHAALAEIVKRDLTTTRRNATEFVARMRELADEIEAVVMPSEEV